MLLLPSTRLFHSNSPALFHSLAHYEHSDAQQKAAAAGAAIEMDDLDVEDDFSSDQLMLGTFLALSLLFRLSLIFRPHPPSECIYSESI